MDLLFSTLILIVLAILAVRFGYDSRDGFQSNEEQLARLGMSWGNGLPIPLVRRRRRVRRALARALFALAEWLSPGLPAVRTS
jgi:hypothetical protein